MAVRPLLLAFPTGAAQRDTAVRAETHLAKFLAQLQHSLPVLSPTGPAVNFYLTKILSLVLYLVIKKIVSFFSY